MEIRNDLIRLFGNVWQTDLPFYHNIAYNTATAQTIAKNPETIHEYWSYTWSSHLAEDVKYLLRDKYMGSDGDRAPRAFWYAVNPSLWDHIFYDAYDADLIPQEYRDNVAKYKQYSQELVDYWTAKGHLDLSRHVVGPYQAGNASGQIRIPPSLKHKSSKSDPDFTQLQRRVNMLENRLKNAQQEANTQHLLEQVLEHLEA